MVISWQHRIWLIFIGVSGCFCVLFGAWLAHAASHLSPELITRLTTAHQYQMLHTIALLAVAVWHQHLATVKPSKLLTVISWLFILGILCFSGSLYLKTLLAMPVIGKLAPIGGVTLALAWLGIAIYGVTAGLSQRYKKGS